MARACPYGVRPLQGLRPLLARAILAIAVLGFAFAGCGLTDVADLTEPGRVQVFIRYEMPADYPVKPGDSLHVVTREFRLLQDTIFAEVYQHPDQYMFSNDSLVTVNMLDRSNEDTPIQIAHSSVAPLEYDHLVFEMSPDETVKIDGRRYPLRRTGEGGGTVVEVERPIVIEERRTTRVFLTFAVHRLLYRLGDEFVFQAHADSVVVEDPRQ